MYSCMTSYITRHHQRTVCSCSWMLYKGMFLHRERKYKNWLWKIRTFLLLGAISSGFRLEESPFVPYDFMNSSNSPASPPGSIGDGWPRAKSPNGSSSVNWPPGMCPHTRYVSSPGAVSSRCPCFEIVPGWDGTRKTRHEVTEVKRKEQIK